MKTLKLVLAVAALAVLSITLSSCESTTNSTSGTYKSVDFSIPAWNYSDNYYLVDTLYKRSFTEYYNNITSGYQDSNRINSILEVWVQCNASDPDSRFCVGKVMLGARPPQGYDSSITKPENIAGDKFTGYFKQMYTGYDYSNQCGMVGLRNDIPENYYLGVVYTDSSKRKYGKGVYESGIHDTLILKLVKVDNPNPVTTPLAWQLKMKNVYRLPYGNIGPTSKIYLKYIENSVYYEKIPGYDTMLITALKLDRVNNYTKLPPPDGIIDMFVDGRILNVTTGYIIFPSLEPFSQGLNGAGVPSQYWFDEIYNQSKTQTQQSTKANMYKLMGTEYYIE